jgi:hypothetical protein
MGSTPDGDAIAAAMPTPHIVFNELSRLLVSKACLADESSRLPICSSRRIWTSWPEHRNGNR